MQSFRDRNGFDRDSVTLANWRTSPYSRWAFAHAGEMIPSTRIGGAGADPLSRATAGGIPKEHFDCVGFSGDLRGFLSHSQSDALLVAKAGRLVMEWWADHAYPNRPHLLFSVTKSVAGMVAGILQDAGELDVARCVGDYLPKARRGAYGDCPLQSLLDMRVSLDFSESYLDRAGDYARYRRAMLWNPPEPDMAPENLAEMVVSIRKGTEAHGGAFHYQSPNSDVLGVVIEAAAGARFSDLVSELIWRPMGARGDAEITVDAAGHPRTAGGMSALAEDLLRLGLLMNAGGGGLVSDRWVEDLRTGGDDAAWAMGNYHDYIVGGRYRNQWYMWPRPSRTVAAIGIHGQYLWACPERDVVIVKLGSQALPQDDAMDDANIAFLPWLADLVAG